MKRMLKRTDLWIAVVSALFFCTSPARDQIEYVDEEPLVRARFQEELAKRNLTTLMPDEAYRNRDYEWSYGSK
jgi:hypothetical protein